jgi:hemerythrin-like metal-binding protein
MESSPETSFIEWDDERYSTEIERFDDQHRHLFGLLNDLHEAMDEGRSEEEVGDILRELERYTEYHFGDEEEFMQDCGFSMDCADCFYSHRDKHEEFAEKVSELREKHENGEYITMEVLMFARDWLDSHIAGGNQDQSYSDYYHENLADDYEYTPGKLNKNREVEAAHPEELRDDTTTADLEVAVDSEVQSGEQLSVPDGPMAAWFERVAQRYGDRDATVLPNRQARKPKTFAQLFERARGVAAGLLEYGLEPGDRVGIYADPRYEWSVVDLACHLAGLVSVPISNLYPDDRALHIVDDAGVTAVVGEATLPVPIEQAVDIAFYIDDLPTAQSIGLPGYDRNADDVATIVYKLGTDKHPRGCALTNRNLLAGVAMLGERLPLGAGGTGTCFLPLAHIYQRLATYHLWHTGNAVAYMTTDEFDEQLRDVQPEVLVGVPQAYKQLHDSIEGRMAEMNGAKKFLSNDVARSYGAAMRDGERASSGLSLKHSMAERTVFSSLREEFGLSDVEYALTGTDSIDDELLQFFWGFGLPLSEVYESTELTGLATMTAFDSYRTETVDAPFPGTDVALADDGEVLVRGPAVMDGYWDDDEATAYAIRDGWYLTGDVGEFTEDGQLRIVDTK